ncbi:AMP-binding protein [Paraliomyxa miuraensis]|uniref:AMP-binding protein n=1 Tax=Paraliomyxa miuraensis TaxID=376150 RepID=UPI002254D97B|nr:AMP-binding protein [Paraliomyxa miuraensis]MCX4245909.1 AMP-binding protein [Paraliomyxa miuraensis]
MSTATPGHMYTRLAEAVASKGGARSVHGPENTLSRRGLLIRADKRARELQGLGIGRGDPVALSLGNVAELPIMLLACSKLGAVAVPIDAAHGERLVKDTASRLPLRAVVRRPRGQEAPTPDYGDDYGFHARRRLSSSLLAIDVLEPPAALREATTLPEGAELVMEARGIGGVVRDVVRTGTELAAVGEAAAAALQLHAGARLLCAQPLIVPRFFDPVILGWLASEAQLVMAEGPAADAVLPLSSHHEELVVVDSVRQLLELSRALKARGTTLGLTPVIPQASVPLGTGRALQATLTQPARQLLLLEEIGVLAHRVLQRGAAFEPAPGVELRPGAAMESGGHEVLVSTPQAAACRPPIPRTEPGAIADAPWRHTGYAGRFGKDERLIEVLGRDDGLVNLEGRRACLDDVEERMLEHPRLTWVRAHVEVDADGDPSLWLEYRATGQSTLDDLEEHAIGQLPPFMVPRRFERCDD